MDLLELWKEKHAAGKVIFDERMLVVQPASARAENYSWGTVFYSQAREDYKTRIKADELKSAATFDPDLMRELEIARWESLRIAANPNSLFAGHLVIYPAAKHVELDFDDLFEITKLAAAQPSMTFIHNMERAAASILDWVHYQAYPLKFPIEDEATIDLAEAGGIRLSRVSPTFPAYAVAAESADAEILSRWLFGIVRALSAENGFHRTRVPFNLIWRGQRVWIVPRAEKQTALAQSYIGALEMGGIFCLPNADEFRRYLPQALRGEIINASLACEPETQKWFEENAVKELCRIG